MTIFVYSLYNIVKFIIFNGWMVLVLVRVTFAYIENIFRIKESIKSLKKPKRSMKKILFKKNKET